MAATIRDLGSRAGGTGSVHVATSVPRVDEVPVADSGIVSLVPAHNGD